MKRHARTSVVQLIKDGRADRRLKISDRLVVIGHWPQLLACVFQCKTSGRNARTSVRKRARACVCFFLDRHDWLAERIHGLLATSVGAADFDGCFLRPVS